MTVIQIAIANQQRTLKLDRRQLRAAICSVLKAHGYPAAEISLAIVDDAAIQALNRQWLEHDYPTDVLSFVLEIEPGRLEGEVVVSADTALRVAGELGVDPLHELALYVVHGTLHLVGFDDQTPALARQMRAAEVAILTGLGIPVVDRVPTPAPGRSSARQVRR
ncbi:MAG: rRNA maturation RNase YbeY [Planctomycetaceae bacterium]|nr:rRNA maturation RNase YbeY [Planctomycetaceae bacterium]